MKILVVIEEGIVQQVYAEDTEMQFMILEIDPEFREAITISCPGIEPINQVFDYPRIADELSDHEYLDIVREWLLES